MPEREDTPFPLADAAARIEHGVTIAKPPADVIHLGPCFLTHYTPNQDGYARVFVRGERPQYAHKIIFQAFHGDIPDGMTVHHLCEVRRCCAPRHLTLESRADHAALHNRKRKGHKATAEQRRARVNRRVEAQGGKVYINPFRKKPRPSVPRGTDLEERAHSEEQEAM
jgi:hypothetical protein